MRNLVFAMFILWCIWKVIGCIVLALDNKKDRRIGNDI
jgi:hypothetical protein